MPTPTVARSRSPAATTQACTIPVVPCHDSNAENDSSAKQFPSQDEVTRPQSHLSIDSSVPTDIADPKRHVSDAGFDHDASRTVSSSPTSQVSLSIGSQSPPSTPPAINALEPAIAPKTAIVPETAGWQPAQSLQRSPWEYALPMAPPVITSTFLRPYSRFAGTQRSDKSVYNVEVELKYVDMATSSLCGFLKIEGLTEHLPTITTYFDGEIIGTKYAFQTQHPDWGASERVDMSHWSRFKEFRPLYSLAKAHKYHDAHFAQREHIFMRWKEQFLVPDHKQKDLPGASFEGFYYIVFNQTDGTIQGIYFHSKSEKFQKLELKAVRERPFTTPAICFR